MQFHLTDVAELRALFETFQFNLNFSHVKNLLRNYHLFHVTVYLLAFT